jgi:hypothetical protein
VWLSRSEALSSGGGAGFIPTEVNGADCGQTASSIRLYPNRAWPAIACRVDARPAPSEHLLVLKLDPRSLSDSMAGTVTVETDDVKQPVVTIPVAAILTSQ